MLTFINILALSLHLLIGGGDSNIIVSLLWWCQARGFLGFGCFLGVLCVVCGRCLWR
jgi:hypothetical protein